MIQETKLKSNETISCVSVNDFQVYYLNRQKSQGGGVALGVNKDYESTLINEGDDETEAISVKVFLKEFPVRVVTAYGPQENALKDKKDKFWEFMEKEVNDAKLEDDGLLIPMDGNLHAGLNLIKEDPNKQNQNGKLFVEFLERNPHLTVVNTLDVCEGVITRRRELENRIEEAVLDFYIINEKMRPFIRKMKIDEDKEFGLVNLAQYKKNKRLIETDHNGLILEMDLNLKNNKPKRVEILNLKNRVCQDAFREETDKNQDLLDCFSNNLSFEAQSKKWVRTFNNILKNCFKKTRIVPKKEKSKTEKLLIERVKLKKEAKVSHIDDTMKEQIRQRIKEIEDDIGEDVANENFKFVVETMKDLGEEGDIYGSGRKKIWAMLKKRFPKTTLPIPVGKKDSKGRLVTNHKELKNLYLKTYKQRMRNRAIKDEFVDIKHLKEELFETRLKLG